MVKARITPKVRWGGKLDVISMPKPMKSTIDVVTIAFPTVASVRRIARFGVIPVASSRRNLNR